MPNSPDRPQIRSRENSPKWLKYNSKKLLQQKNILENTTAYHGTFTIPQGSEEVDFSYLNPALKSLFTSKDDGVDVPNYLAQRLKIAVQTNDWEQETNPTFIVPFNISETKKSNPKFYGLTIENR